MKLKRVMIAAPGSGSGKTTITCALLQTLKKMGLRAASYKCGPDYIDPMFHEKALGIPSKNLDTFFTGEEATRYLLLKNRTEEDIAILEGVMGIFDGLGGSREEGSSYHLAKVTKTPVILVVDAKGMGRSLIPLIAGFLAYDREHLVKGVILNRMRRSYFETAGPMIEKELGVRVLGFFEEREDFRLESRHLGLLLPDETAHVEAWLETVSEAFQKTVSVKGVLEIAKGADPLAEEAAPPFSGRSAGGFSARVAVARDEAFCFYYEDNLQMLREMGAEIAYFSPLHDRSLPEGCGGILLGGGYPEVYAEALSANTVMLKEIKKAAADRMPITAECGGFLYLHDEMIDRKGRRYPMAGVVPAVCRDTGRLVRFGYVEIEEKQGYFLPKGGKIKGHEFHYFDSEDNGCGCLAVKPATGKSYPCMMTGEQYWMGFPHLYYPSNPAFAENFLKKAEAYGRR